jgi:hypothetical protein
MTQSLKNKHAFVQIISCSQVHWMTAHMCCPGPSPNIVSRVGSGPQFAGASGTGNQVASAVSGPGLQQNNVGTNSPDLLNTPGFTDGLGGGGFSGFGKRRLQQSFFGSATTASSGEQSDLCLLESAFL